MIAPFDRIIIDGAMLDGEAAAAYCRTLGRTYNNADWVLELTKTLSELLHNKDLPLEVRTSGTTGEPMPMKITREDLSASAQLTAQAFGLEHGDRTLLCLPCTYIAGQMMVVRAIVLGLDLHIIDPRGSVLDNLKTTGRFRFAAMVPLQLHRALQEDRARVGEQFDTILLGGGPASAALVEELQGLSTHVLHSYGSTETITHVALRKLNGTDRSDHFTAIGNVTFATDDRGCLIIRTPHLSTPEHVTNDLVDLMDRTHFRWLGRHDNVILSGGKKIFPEQLEAKTAAIIPYPHFFAAVPDDRLGQAVVLVVESDRDPGGIAHEVLKQVGGALERHQVPRSIVTVFPFQRTASGKIQRARTLMMIQRPSRR